MKTAKLMFLLLLPLMINSCFRQNSANIVSETRNIYIGDVINLAINAAGYSLQDIREKFNLFEIIELKKELNTYYLSIRTFETGSHSVILGDKEIVIDIKSTLKDITHDGLFDGDLHVLQPGIIFYWQIQFYIAAGVLIITGILFLRKIIINKRIKKLSPYQLFSARYSSLKLHDKNCLVDLTFYFKEYIGSLYNCRIIGKTSAEIINELKNINFPGNHLEKIKIWLTECDRLKFTGVIATRIQIADHCKILFELAGNIENEYKNPVKAGAA